MAIKQAKEQTLPSDVQSCPGVGDDTEGWREGCEDCTRRTLPPADPSRVLEMKPPAIIVFECEFYREPQK